MRSADNSAPPVRGPSTRGSRREVRRERRGPRRPRRRAASVPATPSSAAACTPDRRREHGHVAGQRLEHGQPEALALGRDEHGVAALTQYGTSSGVDAPSVSSGTPRLGELAGAVGALLRRAGSAGKSRSRRVRVEPEPRPRTRRAAAAGSGPGRRRTAAPPPAGACRRRGAARARARPTRSRRGPRAAARRGSGARCAGAPGRCRGTSRRAARAAQRERRPRRQAEVRVDDVEALAAEAPAQLARGARGGAQPGREREQLDLDAVDPPQRVDLVAARSARAPGRAGVGCMFVTTSARIGCASVVARASCRGRGSASADSREDSAALSSEQGGIM